MKLGKQKASSVSTNVLLTNLTQSARRGMSLCMICKVYLNEAHIQWSQSTIFKWLSEARATSKTVSSASVVHVRNHISVLRRRQPLPSEGQDVGSRLFLFRRCKGPNMSVHHCHRPLRRSYPMLYSQNLSPGSCMHGSVFIAVGLSRIWNWKHGTSVDLHR